MQGTVSRGWWPVAALLVLCWGVRRVHPQNLVPYAKEIGGTFCWYLTIKSQLPRSFFRECGEPTCSWDSWHDNLAASKQETTSTAVAVTTAGTTNAAASDKPKRKVRYVLSYAHNGFGNQLWQHTVAFMIAESLQARFFIQAVPDVLCPDGVSPPNTWQGMGAMERLLPSEFLYTSLPRDSKIRQLCDSESFFLADRPRDWRNGSYTSRFKDNVHALITDKRPRCIKLLGYFQGYPLCREDTRNLWTPRLIANFTKKPGPNDLSIYLRCVPRHYFFNDRHFYETILNNTQFDHVWLFQAPECPTKLGKDPSKDGQVASVMRLLIERFNATRWPMYQGDDDSLHLLHDLAGLVQSKKLIIPVSSWAYWAGLLSNATEIHVNGPPYHPMMGGMPQYVYHDQKKRMYFGRFNNKTNDIDFALENNPDKPSAALKGTTAKALPGASAVATAAVGAAATAAAGAAAAVGSVDGGVGTKGSGSGGAPSSGGTDGGGNSSTLSALDRVRALYTKYNTRTNAPLLPFHRDRDANVTGKHRRHNGTHHAHHRRNATLVKGLFRQQGQLPSQMQPLAQGQAQQTQQQHQLQARRRRRRRLASSQYDVWL
jgi:hypothetical protein